MMLRSPSGDAPSTRREAGARRGDGKRREIDCAPRGADSGPPVRETGRGRGTPDRDFHARERPDGADD